MRNIRKGLAACAVLAVAATLGSPASDGAARQLASRGYSVIPVDRMAPDMRDAYLRGIRAELLAHGYDAGRPGAADGGKFTAAIRAYQRDAGLPVDGVASKELLDHLMFVLPKTVAGRPLRHENPAPKIAALPVEPISPGIESPAIESKGGLVPGFKGLPRGPVISRKLAPPAEAAPQPPQRKGGSGVVTQLQQHLKKHGYYQGKVDGVFGDDLGTAVRRYQKDKNLPVTGVIDGPLLNAILPRTTARD